jgi:hypothetical protein
VNTLVAATRAAIPFVIESFVPRRPLQSDYRVLIIRIGDYFSVAVISSSKRMA